MTLHQNQLKKLMLCSKEASNQDIGVGAPASRSNSWDIQANSFLGSAVSHEPHLGCRRNKINIFEGSQSAPRHPIAANLQSIARF